MSDQELKQKKKLPPKGGGGSGEDAAGLDQSILDNSDLIAALSGGITLAQRMNKDLGDKLKAEQPRSCPC